MGRVKIVSHQGGALYRAIPVYDFTTLDAEVSKIQQANTEYSAQLLKMATSIALLEDEYAVTRAAMDHVIQQYKDKLIQDLEDFPPPLDPPEGNDPDTGLPWDDAQKGWAAELFAAINTVRTGAGKTALTRSANLDTAIAWHLSDLISHQRSGHFGYDQSLPAGRVHAAGYTAITVEELLAYGNTSPASVIEEWQRTSNAILIDADLTDCGVGYRYDASYPGTYLWGAVLAQPGSPTEQAYSISDPAAQQGENAEKATNAAIPDGDFPRKLAQAAAAFGKAAAKLKAGQADMARLMAEHLSQIWRLSELQGLKTRLNATEIDIWCADYTETLVAGQEYGTFEVPGFYIESGVYNTSTIYAGTTNERVVTYFERSINIAPNGTRFPPHGKLRLSTNMTAAGVFYNLAIEPGHYRWKPWCRYGIVTYSDSDVCNVTLNDCTERDPEAESRVLALGGGSTLLDLNPPSRFLTDVPGDYMNVGAQKFAVGDEVLVYFKNFDWTQPRVIGFRRAPKSASGRLSWTQAYT